MTPAPEVVAGRADASLQNVSLAPRDGIRRLGSGTPGRTRGRRRRASPPDEATPARFTRSRPCSGLAENPQSPQWRLRADARRIGAISPAHAATERVDWGIGKSGGPHACSEF